MKDTDIFNITSLLIDTHKDIFTIQILDVKPLHKNNYSLSR